jgi:three-Cys-motif partner protein
LADTVTYTGREQTLVKHFILRKHLERFAHIIGAHWDTITYVDCFAGPWNVRSERLEDSSFHIALEQLRKARATHRQRGREIRLRCFFIEKDVKVFQLLRAFAERTEDAEIETRNSELEDAIDPIIRFGKRWPSWRRREPRRRSEDAKPAAGSRSCSHPTPCTGLGTTMRSENAIWRR